MKHLKLYEDYNNQEFITDYDEAVQWLEDNWNDMWDAQFDPSKLTKNDDGTFNYDGYVNLGSKDKRIDRIAVEFNYVSGDFNCVDNNLVTLEGSPRRVEGSFSCQYNNLVTLEGSPRRVEGSFSCQYNNLVTLEGSPRYVGGNFDCYDNSLVTLEHAPDYVGDYFSCQYNNLVTLEHAPDYVGKIFYCSSNMLTKKDSKHSLGSRNPGYKETDLNKIANKFLEKLKTKERFKGHEGRILKALKQFKPEVYKAVEDVADFDLDYWINNIEKARKHDDIIDL